MNEFSLQGSASSSDLAKPVLIRLSSFAVVFPSLNQHRKRYMIRVVIVSIDSSQVDIYNTEFALFAPFTKLLEDLLDEVIPLGMHIVEGTAHEHIDGLPGEGHG
jgi:hypothetical protein